MTSQNGDRTRDGAPRNPAADPADDDRIDRRLEASFSALATAGGDPPPMGPALLRELANLGPATTRLPRRECIAVIGLSLFYATGILAWMGIRDDLPRLPITWLLGLGAVWSATFLAGTWLVLVPPKLQVMPRWRRAAAVAAIGAIVLIAAGLFRPEAVAALGFTYPATPSSILRRGHGCMQWGLTVAVLPAVLTGLAVRGAVPVGSRWVAAAIGGASGALGGFVLHLHCPIAERFHLGIVHGGIVVVSAVLAVVVAGVAERRRRGRQ